MPHPHSHPHHDHYRPDRRFYRPTFHYPDPSPESLDVNTLLLVGVLTVLALKQ